MWTGWGVALCLYVYVHVAKEVMIDMWGSTLENTEATIVEWIKIMKLQSNGAKAATSKIQCHHYNIPFSIIKRCHSA